MPLHISLPVFLGSLGLMIFGSVLVARALGRLGPRLNVPEQFMGFVTALAADSPEISSTVVAMLSGQTNVGVGVVFGSNLFNLASLLGITAVIAGRISVRRNAALLDGSVGLLVTGAAVLLVTGLLPAPIVAGFSFAVVLTYVYLLALPRERLQELPIPQGWRTFFVSAASDAKEHGKQIKRTGEEEESDRQRKKVLKHSQKLAQGKPQKEEAPESTSKLTFVVSGSLAMIVVSSFGLVRSATWLTSRWLPQGLLGTLLLAALTGIPNLYTAVRLALRKRGSAVVTEAMNSNSLNILVGLMIPSLVFGSLSARTVGGYLDTGLLLFLTALSVALLSISKGLRRAQGFLIIALYLAFAAVRIWLW